MAVRTISLMSSNRSAWQPVLTNQNARAKIRGNNSRIPARVGRRFSNRVQ
jgi:hypothetical protein